MKKLIFLLLLAVSITVYSQDKKGCDTIEPAYLNRLPGFSITECKYSEYNEKEFIYYVGGKAIVVKDAGVYREIWYWKNEGETRNFSSAQVILNYNNAILKNKGEVLGDNKNFMTASINGKKVYMQIPSSNSASVNAYQLFILEVGNMKQDIVLNLQEALDRDGKAALYGILFDVGKSDIKPESASELKKISDYLNTNKSVKIIIVGHTDNTGNYESNITLSKSRAESVKKWLVTNGKIDAARLRNEGAGMFCPVASNDTENGRKQNRRVEIVKQ
jgi:outer membrane protein OmpA-like peptidoglycan-associated protein